MEKVPMTAEGYTSLEAEIKNLKTAERPRIIKLIAEARSHGDLSENAEYHAAKELQGITEARIADLEDKLSRADIIDVSKLKGDQVSLNNGAGQANGLQRRAHPLADLALAQAAEAIQQKADVLAHRQ